MKQMQTQNCLNILDNLMLTQMPPKSRLRRIDSKFAQQILTHNYKTEIIL